jgi:2'-5' RNA ligase
MGLDAPSSRHSRRDGGAVNQPMSGADSRKPDSAADGLECFRSIQTLHNHWSRPAGPPAYYWYLTFERSPELHSLVTECQEAISFPFYDLIPVSGLHVTLDRIAFEGDITLNQLEDIETAARDACQEMTSFAVTIGHLSGTPGAIGFTAYPIEPISRLRGVLRTATLSIRQGAPLRDSEFHPHVTIAYANADNIPAAQVIEIVERLNAIASADVIIREAALVLLERGHNSYSWDVVSQVPLRSDYENLPHTMAGRQSSFAHQILAAR